MKRFFLLASLGVLACHRDRDLKICEYNPDYCADASPDADAISSETELDTGSAPDVETDSIADPPTAFEGRVGGASAWTGGELFVHGGTPTLEGTAPFANGAYYQHLETAPDVERASREDLAYMRFRWQSPALLGRPQ